ncbi:MAG TPA: hypothetical protein PK020_17235 [Ilumatobacteraceae bacterium]|nr:hypothetical protein [Ilumatobacteraceae bacterium]HRB03098.1 hypothetical protein [Ilumatobacteraceae bacterium]
MTPHEHAALTAQIAEAEAAGNWKLSGRLKMALPLSATAIEPEPEPPTPGVSTVEAALAAGDFFEAQRVAGLFGLEEMLPSPASIDQGSHGGPTPGRTLEDREREAYSTHDRAAQRAIGREKTASMLNRNRR